MHPQRCPGQTVHPNSSGTLAEVLFLLLSRKKNSFNLKWLVSKRNILLQGSCSGSVLVFRGCTSRLQEYLEITNTRTWIESHIDGYFAEKPGEMALHELPKKFEVKIIGAEDCEDCNLDKDVVMWGSELRSQGWWIEPQNSQNYRVVGICTPFFLKSVWRISKNYCIHLYAIVLTGERWLNLIIIPQNMYISNRDLVTKQHNNWSKLLNFEWWLFWCLKFEVPVLSLSS